MQSVEEKRRHKRFNSLNLSYVCVDESGRIVYEGMGRTLNVSESGILLETHFPTEFGQILSMTVAFEENLLNLRGKVVHCREGRPGKYETGVQFSELEQDVTEIFKQYVTAFERQQQISSRPIFETDFFDLMLIKRGKVRDMYDLGDSLLMVASDRISAYDVVMPEPVPQKGKVLTQISLFWFDVMSSVVKNHLISADPDDYPESCKPYTDILKGRSMMVVKATPIPIECVVRGYLSGSGWESYQKTGTICGIALPQGLKESDKLPEPIFTPSTKEEIGVHDINIDFEETVKRIGRDLAEKIRDLSLAIYKKGSELADKKGIIIADTKFEFGLLGDEIILIDEVLTPDSSRFWPKDSYQPGTSQKSFDKQYLRDYLTSVRWNKQRPAPFLPDEVIRNTSQKYLEAFRCLTGEDHLF